MRLICTLSQEEIKNPYAFSWYLASQGIENQCEEEPEEGGYLYRIWVFDEDQVDKALDIYREYQENPDDPRYRAPAAVNSPFQEEISSDEKFSPKQEESVEKKPQRRWLSPAPYGRVTLLLLFACITLFIITMMQKPSLSPPALQGVIQAPLFSKLEKSLLYDYPHYFVLRDELIQEYQPQLEKKEALPPTARSLLRELLATPVWMGIYDRFLNHLRSPSVPLSYQGPLFEKIAQGEVWRTFTPALLHLDLLHIFFNALWLILLGNQIEFRLGKWRYLVLILATGIFSNTAQYLVSGPFFMGLSGIVVGMAAFIWARQQIAPWEGYLLNRFTLIFLGVFVIGMFVLQLILFILQTTGTLGFSVGIANTAHLTGGIVGYLLGRFHFFALHPSLHKKN